MSLTNLPSWYDSWKSQTPEEAKPFRSRDRGENPYAPASSLFGDVQRFRSGVNCPSCGHRVYDLLNGVCRACEESGRATSKVTESPMNICLKCGVAGFADGWYIIRDDGTFDGPHKTSRDAEDVLDAMTLAEEMAKQD